MLELLSALVVILIIIPFLAWTFMSFYSKTKRTRIVNFKTIVWSLLIVCLALAIVVIVIMIFLV